MRVAIVAGDQDRLTSRILASHSAEALASQHALLAVTPTGFRSDFHAVFEAFLDGRWWLFDATRQAYLDDDLVRIGAGRDAAESRS